MQTVNSIHEFTEMLTECVKGGSSEMAELPNHISRRDGVDMGTPRYRKQNDRVPSGKVVLNISGVRFETTETTLAAIPNTRLACLSHHSDNFENGEYFFDRNPESFGVILDYYRTRELHMPYNACGKLFKRELEFWDIDDDEMSLCCLKRYGESDAVDVVMESFIDRTKPRYHENISVSNWEQWKRTIWNFLDKPSSSTAAKVPVICYVLATVAVVTVGFLETLPMYRDDRPLNGTFDNNTASSGSQSWENRRVLIYVFNVSAVYFCIEFLLRLVFCPSKKIFFKSFFTYLDIALLVVMIVGLLCNIKFVNCKDTNDEARVAFMLIESFRVFLILKVLKFARYNVGMKVLLMTIRASFREMFLLTTIMMIASLFFAMNIYSYEFSSDENMFPNAAYGIWWAIVTMTTVGYGDFYPKTWAGYVTGTLCALTGMILTALPIAVIGGNFSTYLGYAHDYQTRMNKLRKGDTEENAISKVLERINLSVEKKRFKNKISQKLSKDKRHNDTETKETTLDFQ